MADDHLRVGGQRIGIDGGNKYRLRGGFDLRHAAEWAGTQGHPQTGFDQLFARLFTRQLLQLGGLKPRQLRRARIRRRVIQFNDHRLQYATLATVDLHAPGRCRGAT